MFSENQSKALIGKVSIDIKANRYRIRFTYPKGRSHELNETVLQPKEVIEFEGQAVVANFNIFPVRVHKVKSVRKGAFINTECRRLVVEIHTKAEFEDYSAKLRGQWVKGMTTRSDDYVVKDTPCATFFEPLILLGFRHTDSLKIS